MESEATRKRAERARKIEQKDSEFNRLKRWKDLAKGFSQSLVAPEASPSTSHDTDHIHIPDFSYHAPNPTEVHSSPTPVQPPAPAAAVPPETLLESLRVEDNAGPSHADLKGFKTTFKIITVGKGSAVISKGSKVTIHATGIVKGTGKVVWSTKDEGDPFKYNAGAGLLFDGLEQGCLGMKVGEERELIIPPVEAYGSRGHPDGGVPSNATLIFTLECLAIE